MPKVPTHALVWSGERGVYELRPADPLLSSVVPGEEELWFAWLSSHASFSFQGQAGRLNMLKEARPRGSGYWYAYQTKAGRTRKRYLGRTQILSLARLEETARTLMHGSGAEQAPDQGIVVLSSKLALPRLSDTLVERKRLLVALDGALSTPLTLLCAPAGFGKTTLLSTWATQHQALVAWLSLDELDNSPTRFWVGLIAALRHGGRYALGFGETAVTLLQSPQPAPLAAILTALLQELENHQTRPTPLVLILDDYQVIEEQAIHESLSFFLEHIPAHLHLLLSSRVDPALPLSRLRVRGQLTEIRADDLRFSLEEANHYLNLLLSLTLSAEEVSRLVKRTEGWIAGLQLAALTLQKREDRAAFLQAFTGSQRYLLDYVQEEILARLPPSVRDFLLHTAILSQMSASLCQAVTGEPTLAESVQMLTLLERANLFLVPLDEERRSYRLHELFREALLSVLHTSQPESVPLLHRRAADFYEAQGQWAEAITHRLAAMDFSAAARLMEQTVERFWVRGEAATIAGFVLTLPELVGREHPRLLLTTALYLLNSVKQTTQEQRTRIYQQARRLMARIEAALRQERGETDQDLLATNTGVGAVLPSDWQVRTEESALLRRRLHLLHISMVFWETLAQGEFGRLNTMRAEIEEELDQDEEAIWQIIPLELSFILHFTVWQAGAALVPHLLSAKEQVSRLGGAFASLRVRQYLAVAAVEAGRLHLAYEESQVALDGIERFTGYALLKGYFEMVQAQVWYQWNHLEQARSLLQTVVQDAAAWQHLDVLGWGYAVLIQVALVTCDGVLAEHALREVEQLVQHERYGTYPGWLPALRAQWWLAQGKLEAASDWAAGVVFPQGSWEGSFYNAFPVLVRVWFAEQRWAEAASLLNIFRSHLDRPANIRITLTYLAQSLVALHQTGRGEQAREVAARLFALTEPEGYLRVFLDEGKPMKHALKALLATPLNTQQDTASASLPRSYVGRLLAAFEQEESLMVKPPPTSGSPFVPTQESLSAPADQRPLPRELLSPQEFKVLRLLVAGCTYAEVAQSLVVSIHTIKTQVSSIYRKLGVSRRAEAIAASRRFHLL